VPASTAQDHYKSTMDPVQEASAAKQRKQEQQLIFNKVRGTKPNFRLGGDQLDYATENKGQLSQPAVYTYDKSAREAQMATQRAHNFKMSYEGGTQF